MAVDINADNVAETAAQYGCTAMTANVAVEGDIARVIEDTEAAHGPIDLFCSNAGIGGGPDEQSPCRTGRLLGCQCHVACLCGAPFAPRMIARGGGYFVNTASAAGCSTRLAARYGVTKHAAVGFGEWLALTHAHKGIKVSMLCPQAVRTAMTANVEGNDGVRAAAVDGMMEANDVADCVVQGIEAESFLILLHSEVAGYMKRKPMIMTAGLAVEPAALQTDRRGVTARHSLCLLRQVNRRIAVEEIARLQDDFINLGGHDRPILGQHMMKTNRRPADQISFSICSLSAIYCGRPSAGLDWFTATPAAKIPSRLNRVTHKLFCKTARAECLITQAHKRADIWHDELIARRIAIAFLRAVLLNISKAGAPPHLRLRLLLIGHALRQHRPNATARRGVFWRTARSNKRLKSLRVPSTSISIR